MLKSPLKGKARRKALLKDWGNTALEVCKWALVVWLMWPIRNAAIGPIDFWRIAGGILLFIIFAGKLFYDSIIMDIIRQRRTSLKRDIVTLLGMAVIVALVVGFTLFFSGFLVVKMMEKYSNPVSGES